LGIGTRLSVAFAALILLLAAIGGYSALNASRLARDLEASASYDLARIDLASGLMHVEAAGARRGRGGRRGDADALDRAAAA
jgi:hypothetical protein